MLRIHDPKPTMHFYIELMGMRTVFVQNTGPFTVYFLGYPQTPTHRADPAAFSHDTMAVMSNTLGLLELVHYHGSEAQKESIIVPGSRPPHLGFNHLGFSVPDVGAAVGRLRTSGVKVVKDVNEGPNDVIPFTKWEHNDMGLANGALDPKFQTILSQIAFVEDPVSRQPIDSDKS
ncbi:hypothetical protein JX266_012984 [Neoarthrinium moseri]|nr:hypothetical protein JX266_012984 [Neoarthrinium moseri]